MRHAHVAESFPSLCPRCLRTLPARVEVHGDVVYGVKACSEHGPFRDVLCHDAAYFEEIHRFWDRDLLPAKIDPAAGGSRKGCPYDCPTCDRHRILTLVAFIDVTYRCNLDCWICYANSGYRNRIPDPTTEQVIRIMKTFRDRQTPPPKRLQLSGGEPTIRNDLPHLVRQAVKLGFEEIGVNTNGIRLARDPDLCRELIESGVTKISLQFDGVDDETYRRIRGVDLYRIKVQVIENVRKVKSGVVQLVCAVAKGLNDHEIPRILDFAADNADVVSGVSFLPVAFCGRDFDQSDVVQYRVTTPYVQSIINRHTNGVCASWPSTHTLVRHLRFVLFFLDGRPIGHSSHPQCGSLQIVYVTQDRRGTRRWRSLWDLLDLPGIEADSERVWNRYERRGRNTRRGLRWRLAQAAMIWIVLKHVRSKALVVREVTVWCVNRITDALWRRHSVKRLGDLHGLFRNMRYLLIFCVNFQDLYNINVERIQRCTFHFGYFDPADDAVRVVPFCSMNTIHRKTIQNRLIEFAERHRP